MTFILMWTKLVFWTIFIQCFITITGKSIFKINYCSTKFCNGTKKHTLCKFQSSEPAADCIDYVRTMRTFEEKQALLDKINSRRNKISSGEVRSFPPAENMMKLDWNEELEKSAQKWADQCVGKNGQEEMDVCRDLGDIPVGQSISSVYGDAPGLSPLSLVDVWYMELLNTNSSILPRYRPSSERGFSHYDYFTQLVWARSSEVGCGSVKFKEHMTNKDKYRTVHRLVCNFAPTGNVLGEAVYNEGPPCSRCPNGGSCDSIFNSLCSTTKQTITSYKPEVLVTDDINVKKTSLSYNGTSLTEVNLSYGPESYINDDNSTAFDYFSEVYDFTRQDIRTTSVRTTNLCKDAIAVDDFVELLKKKLATDAMFKDLLSSRAPSLTGNTDSSYTDPSVAAFVNRIYSKKEIPTTTKLPEPDYENSTFLVDLVKAVILKNADTNIASEQIERTTQTSLEANVVNMKAELAEVKQNQDFTGYFFFPEDNNEESVQETTDSYYDTSNLPASDVLLEIESLKRNKVTNDFLDEIIDSDAGIDESTPTFSSLSINEVSLHNNDKQIKKFLKDIGSTI